MNSILYIVLWFLALLLLLFFGLKYFKWLFEFIDDIIYIIEEKRKEKRL